MLVGCIDKLCSLTVRLNYMDSKGKKIQKMYKVVYFDQDSAGDYLNIFNKGEAKENTEKSTNKQTERILDIKTKLSLGCSAGTTVAFVTELSFNSYAIRLVSGILGGIAAIANMTPITLDFGYKRNREDKEVVSTQVTSTILSQFLGKQEKEEERVLCIKPTDVYIEEKSFAFIKFFAPVLEMINFNSEGIDISKFGEVMRETKGYYELRAKEIDDQSKEKTYILRLNAASFHNNYKLIDLLNMKLTYYGIKVGKMSLDKLDFQQAFKINEESNNTPEQAYWEIEQEDALEANKNGDNEYDVIDIILAGVGEYDKN